MFYVYMIYTNINNKIITYVGWTNNLHKRITIHNSGKGAKFTKGKKWKLLYKKRFVTKSKAMQYEYLLKKDRKKRNLLKNNYLNETI